MTVFLQNRQNGKIKKGYLGFSFTTLFFGAFVPLFRGDFRTFLPILFIYLLGIYFMPYTYSNIDGMYTFSVISSSTEIWGVLSSVYFFLINICGAFFYNKIYTRGLIKRGYLPMSPETRTILHHHGIYISRDDI